MGEVAVGVIIQDHEGDPKRMWKRLKRLLVLRVLVSVASGQRWRLWWKQTASVVVKASMKQADCSLISAVIHDIIT
jgi:hypothetical protein